MRRNSPERVWGSRAVVLLEHHYAARRLDAYVDNALHPHDVDRVTGHLVQCDDCSAHVRFLLEVRGSLLRMARRLSF